MNGQLNMIITGLTGQGIVMGIRILATALLSEGKKVLTADVPTPSHRVGSIFAHLRCGDEVYSEFIQDGAADLVVGLEPAECLRQGLVFAKKGGLVITNDRPVRHNLVSPETLRTTHFEYPTIEQIAGYFRRVGVTNIKHFDATEVAIKETGSIRPMNMVMLGALWATGMIPARRDTIENAIARFVPRQTLDRNLKAFRTGISRFQDL